MLKLKHTIKNNYLLTKAILKDEIIYQQKTKGSTD
jgi:hypothetical protein